MVFRQLRYWCALLSLCFTFLTCQALADQPSAIRVPLAPPQLRKLIQARDWEQASIAIGMAIQRQDTKQNNATEKNPDRIALEKNAVEKGEASVDRLLYLKGRVLHFQGHYDAAVATFAELEKRFPNSPWKRRARFAAGIALVKKGDFRRAELLYRAEAEALQSAERKQEFAGIYLEYADAFFSPSEEKTKPNYAEALLFYEKALDAGPAPKRRIAVELLIARCHQLLGKAAKAAQRYTSFIERHPNGRQASEARFRLGECRLACEQPKQARHIWRELIAANDAAAGKWVAEASFLLARTWEIPSPKTDTQMNQGVAALKDFLVRFPTHSRAAQAHLDIAKSYIARKHFEEAVRQLEALLTDKRYRTSKQIPRARQLLGRAFVMQERLADALATWREFLVEHPSDAAWSDVQQQVVDTQYLIAAGKVDTRQFDVARQLFREFLAKYPLDSRGPEILFLFGQISYAQKHWDSAIEDWRRVVSKFPDTDEASHAQYNIAVVLEEKRHKPLAALEEYRKTTWGEYAQHARQAALRLNSKSLAVVTPRVFRSDEKPQLKLTNRNISSVSVSMYKVNLESYFRKMHSTEHIENIDTALIDPDASFVFDIPGHEAYQQCENVLTVALPDDATRGSMVVTVRGGTLEATTLVIQSDLEIVVKASRNEVFVFAENMSKGAPWPGVRLLLSDGQRIFAETTTGPDGVFQATYEQLRRVDDVRVLAVADGHIASNVTLLEGIRVAQGQKDKGYIYTDCPAYRAGQQVRVRGCIRALSDGKYVVDKTTPCHFEVFDVRDRMIWRQEVPIGDFGTFHTQFTLPTTSPQGTYQLRVVNGAKRHFQGTFRVEQPIQQPVRITVETPRRVYCRGEQIKGVIRVAYDYGVPLIGREVTYQLADDLIATATTDAKGEVHFALPTHEFQENQIAPLAVTCSEGPIEAQFNFYLTTQAFWIELGAARDTFVAGEEFELTIATKDATGQPTARQLDLRVLKLSTVDGKVNELPVEDHVVKTATGENSAVHGVAKHTLLLPKRGRYRVRAEGEDRWGNRVRSQFDLVVSDTDDSVRLRILADQQVFRVGDQATVTLHWREKPALALVTFQADHVLDYRLVHLKTGPNKLPIAMNARLAPNFQLEAVVMADIRTALDELRSKKVPSESRPTAEESIEDEPRDNGELNEAASMDRQTDSALPIRFHAASVTLRVERALRVSLAYQRADGARGLLKPGESMEVTISTTDCQGKPIPAEVSLAMVEQTLLDRFKWPLPSIDAFFRARDRQEAVHTGASIGFAYHATTTLVNPLLLDEKDRRELSELGAVQLNSPVAMSEPGESGVANGDRKRLSTRKNKEFESQLVISQVQQVIAQARVDAQDSKRGNMTLQPDETAYWDPAIITDERGKATVTIKLPPHRTAWTLIAKGITRNTLAGETTLELTTRNDLFGELELPLALVEGDKAEVIARVHNNRLARGPIAVTLTTTIAGRSTVQTRNIQATDKRVVEVPFKVALDQTDNSDSATTSVTGEARFQLTVAASGMRDSIHRSVPIRPRGIALFSSTGGSADASLTAWLETPKDTPFHSPRMQIIVGPSVRRTLLDIVLSPARFRRCEELSFAASTDSLSSDLMATIGLQAVFHIGPKKDTPASSSVRTPPTHLLATGLRRHDADTLDRQARTAIASLVCAQNSDGGWSWSASKGTSDRIASARAVWALSLARNAGYEVTSKCREDGVRYLTTQLAASASDDDDIKAILLHALGQAGQPDFSLANRLYRQRRSLSPSALLHLALAFIQMERKQLAVELLAELAGRTRDGNDAQPGQASSSISGSQSQVETEALYALAIQGTAPKEPRTKHRIASLLAHRTGYRWAPDKATGPAALALCRHHAEQRITDDRYEMTLSVNDQPLKTLSLTPAMPTQVIDVPTRLMVAGKQRIHFEIKGQGRFTYQVTLAGHIPATNLKNTTDAWRVVRSYTPALLERDGITIARGFKNVRYSAKQFHNPLTQLPIGRRAIVNLTIERTARVTRSRDNVEYLWAKSTIASARRTTPFASIGASKTAIPMRTSRSPPSCASRFVYPK